MNDYTFADGDIDYTATVVNTHTLDGLGIQIAIYHCEPIAPSRAEFVNEDDYEDAITIYNTAETGYTWAYTDNNGDTDTAEADGFYPAATPREALEAAVEHIVDDSYDSSMIDAILATLETMTTGEAEQTFNLPANSVSRDIHRGKLMTARKSGGSWLVGRSEIESRYNKAHHNPMTNEHMTIQDTKNLLLNNRKKHEPRLTVKDVSSDNSYGYDYAIVRETWNDEYGYWQDEDGVLAESITVYDAGAKNKRGEMGSYRAVFNREDVNRLVKSTD